MEHTQTDPALAPGPSSDTAPHPRGSRRTLAAMTALLAICGAGAVGGFLVVDVRNSMQRETDSRLVASARQASADLSQAIKSDMDAVFQAADRRVLGPVVASGRWSASYAPLVGLLNAHPRLASASLFDLRGALQGRVPGDRSIAGRRFSQQDYFQVARRSKGVHISRLFIEIGPPKGPVIAYSTIVRSSPVRGVLQAATLIQRFQELVARYVPQNGSIRVYDAAGEIVSPSAQASGASHSKEPLVAAALGSKRTTQRTQTAISVAEPVPGTGWGLVLSQPVSAADHDARAQTTRLSELAGAIFVLALIAAVAAWRHG